MKGGLLLSKLKETSQLDIYDLYQLYMTEDDTQLPHIDYNDNKEMLKMKEEKDAYLRELNKQN